ncbi:MarR family winged helix-turn-helix transcriptional regulator [Gehongia tenuis]|uniref:Winged helix-turn-helix transcriptional regulator n=1 Tax=Gehongia tenuis TaxID=2763655 RepID=A0A926D7Q7_9FIRM|nr:MarR family winged helix-turn-helix transcriptional regulator [Gehongia tenuis]MBC8531915.1 winged helix-turn-helix transcriptional regulator [Gehongia tenuis]
MDPNVFQERLMELIRSINLRFTALLHDVYAPLGITPVQAIILLELMKGDSTAGELSKALHMAGSNLSNACKTLERKDLIRRTRDQQDQRIVRLAITEKAQKLFCSLKPSPRDPQFALLREQSDEDLNIILQGLERFNMLLISLDSLEQTGKTYKEQEEQP